MWRRFTSLVLIMAFSLSASLSALSEAERLPLRERGDHTASPTKAGPCLALASIAVPHVGLKTVLAKGLLEVVSIDRSWRSKTYSTHTPRLHNAKTLQSQYALLRI